MPQPTNRFFPAAALAVLSLTLCSLSLAVTAGSAGAVTLTETFSDPFGNWTNRWLYQNSNLGNYYVAAG